MYIYLYDGTLFCYVVLQHGGRANAYTAAEETNYHLEVSHDSLDEALDRYEEIMYEESMKYEV